jgi:hypothetical protein
MDKEKIETVKKDLTLEIRTGTGPVELVGPRADLIKFRDLIKHETNRNIFLECPPHLLTWAPWLVGVTILPKDISVIVLKDKDLAPRRASGVMVPNTGFGPGPVAIC